MSAANRTGTADRQLPRPPPNSSLSHAPTLSAAAAVTVSLLALPFTRRALWSNTFGRLQSDASRLASAERRLAGCSQSLELQGQELGKLTERATLASDEYSRGRSKLLAAGGQLRSLARQSRKTEARLVSLVEDVRRLKGEVPPLAHKAAEQAGEAARQRSMAERALRRVAGLVPV